MDCSARDEMLHQRIPTRAREREDREAGAIFSSSCASISRENQIDSVRQHRALINQEFLLLSKSGTITYSRNRPAEEKKVRRKTTGNSRFSTLGRPFSLVSSTATRCLARALLSRSGIIGGCVLGMLSAILLVMFIIYRMRKKDEGSYALEEGPRKSPSHAYTRVSSREFFA